MSEGKTYWQIWLEPDGVRKPGEFVNFETDAEDLEDLLAELEEEGMVVGWKLFTSRTGEPGVLAIDRRREICIWKGSIRCVEACSVRFVEREGVTQ